MVATCETLPGFRIFFLITAFLLANVAAARSDDTSALKSILRRANGRTVRLDEGKVYEISEKLELKSLCPKGVTIEGNNATVKALPGFQHGVLLTATVLLRDAPYAAGVKIRNLKLDGDGQVGRCLFGNWKNATVENVEVRGGTIYQVNAIWNDSTLSHIKVVGNATQTDNGFDCNLQNSTIWNLDVDMQGNLKESAFWLNGCQHATVINLSLTDGRTAFGLENCKDVNLINLKVRGTYSFRVVNILPAEPSERIHLYDVDIDSRHVGKDASAGVHFNATKGGMVVRGKIRSSGPGVLLTHEASDIEVIDVDLPSEPVHPTSEWIPLTRRKMWVSKRRQVRGRLTNKAPVVSAGPDREAQGLKDVVLESAVADEKQTGELKVAWTKVSGPGQVTFTDAGNPQTNATFSRSGTYTLALSASDGRLESTDEVTLRIGRAVQSRR